MTSDFFIEDADQWREEVWNFIKYALIEFYYNY